MLIVALFTIARTWKQPWCTSADEWIRKLWHIYTMECDSAIKKNTFESVLMRWMKLEPVIQSEVSQKEIYQYSMLLLSRFSHVRICATPWQPSRLPRPGILQARTLEWVAISFSNAWKWKGKWSHSVVSDSSRPHGLKPTRLLHPWDFPGKRTGVGCHGLLHEWQWLHPNPCWVPLWVCYSTKWPNGWFHFLNK